MMPAPVVVLRSDGEHFAISKVERQAETLPLAKKMCEQRREAGIALVFGVWSARQPGNHFWIEPGKLIDQGLIWGRAQHCADGYAQNLGDFPEVAEAGIGFACNKGRKIPLV
jgi:hypothetical protein